MYYSFLTIKVGSNRHWFYSVVTTHNTCLFILDIDECAEKTDNCNDNAKCTNTIGSFTCTCKEGYTGNGVNCKGTYSSYLIHYEGDSLNN